VVAHELLVDPAGLNDVVRDVVQDREVGAWLEDDRDVRQVHAAVGKGGEYRNPHMRVPEAAVGKPGPQDRMHFRHVGAPEHEGIRILEIVITAHRLVHAEGAHEADRRRCHAVTRVGIEVV
jgi:hypothetical protein